MTSNWGSAPYRQVRLFCRFKQDLIADIPVAMNNMTIEIDYPGTLYKDQGLIYDYGTHGNGSGQVYRPSNHTTQKCVIAQLFHFLMIVIIIKVRLIVRHALCKDFDG